jgi:hypothetical protein
VLRVRPTGRLRLVRPVSGGRGSRPILTWADRLVLYAIVGAAAVLLLAPRSHGPGGLVLIEGPNGFRQEVSLTTDAVYDVAGPLGTTEVTVEGGTVCVSGSPCPEHLCMAMGRISSPGETVVCVPNGVVVRVLGRPPGRTDATTR